MLQRIQHFLLDLDSNSACHHKKLHTDFLVYTVISTGLNVNKVHIVRVWWMQQEKSMTEGKFNFDLFRKQSYCMVLEDFENSPYFFLHCWELDKWVIPFIVEKNGPDIQISCCMGKKKVTGDMWIHDKISIFGWTFPLGCGGYVGDGIRVLDDFLVPKQQKGHK